MAQAIVFKGATLRSASFGDLIESVNWHLATTGKLPQVRQLEVAMLEVATAERFVVVLPK